MTLICHLPWADKQDKDDKVQIFYYKSKKDLQKCTANNEKNINIVKYIN